jgi:hypothetical protein
MNQGTVIEAVLLKIAFATDGCQLFNAVNSRVGNKTSKKMALRA